MATLSAVFSKAVRELEWIAANPVEKIAKRKEPKGRVRFLSSDEKTRLEAAYLDSEQPLLYPIVMVAMTTGARRGEVLGIRRGDVDLDLELIRLERTKNGERRTVPLKRKALVLVKGLLMMPSNPADLLFPGRKAGRVIDIKKSWYTALRKAEVEDFRFHDLRHTAASYLAMSGCNTRDIAEILGHKSLQMVARYAHLTPGHSGSVVERMMDKFF